MRRIVVGIGIMVIIAMVLAGRDTADIEFRKQCNAAAAKRRNMNAPNGHPSYPAYWRRDFTVKDHDLYYRTGLVTIPEYDPVDMVSERSAQGPPVGTEQAAREACGDIEVTQYRHVTVDDEWDEYRYRPTPKTKFLEK